MRNKKWDLIPCMQHYWWSGCNDPFCEERKKNKEANTMYLLRCSHIKKHRKTKVFGDKYEPRGWTTNTSLSILQDALKSYCGDNYTQELWEKMRNRC